MKIFAVVEPIFVHTGVYAGLCDLGMSLYHSYADEKVCGYSMNKEIKFFDSLDKAQENFNIHAKILSTFPIKSAARELDKAIIEIEVDNKKIVNFINLHEIKSLTENGNCRWNKKQILSSNMTPNALEQINNKYQAEFGFNAHQKKLEHNLKNK